MTMSQQPETSEPTPTVTDAENNAQLKEIAGLSQGQIVRRRFFRHKGAVASMAVLTFVVILAFTSVGLSIGDWRVPGWWQ